jgi:hypothetical protein
MGRPTTRVGCKAWRLLCASDRWAAPGPTLHAPRKNRPKTPIQPELSDLCPASIPIRIGDKLVNVCRRVNDLAECFSKWFFKRPARPENEPGIHVISVSSRRSVYVVCPFYGRKHAVSHRCPPYEGILGSRQVRGGVLFRRIRRNWATPRSGPSTVGGPFKARIGFPPNHRRRVATLEKRQRREPRRGRESPRSGAPTVGGPFKARYGKADVDSVA